MEFIDKFSDSLADGVIKLYASVGWETYTKDPDGLVRAINNSTYVLICKQDSQVVGLIRSVSDDVSINYIQDILVHKDFQRQGIGTQLMRRCLNRFSHVAKTSLLTDDDPRQLAFYESFGFRNLKELKSFTLNSFVKMNDVDLE